jgi:hypothetical protein
VLLHPEIIDVPVVNPYPTKFESVLGKYKLILPPYGILSFIVNDTFRYPLESPLIDELE